MVNYFQTRRVQAPVVSCEDACLRLHWGKKYEQIPHRPANDCYIRVPAEITPSFAESDERRQDLFIATCFWNNKGIKPQDSHYVELCYTAVTLAGTGDLMPCLGYQLCEIA